MRAALALAGILLLLAPAALAQRGPEAAVAPTFVEADAGALVELRVALEGAIPFASLELAPARGLRAAIEPQVAHADAEGRAAWTLTIAAPDEPGPLDVIVDVLQGGEVVATVSARIATRSSAPDASIIGIVAHAEPATLPWGSPARGVVAFENRGNVSALVTPVALHGIGVYGGLPTSTFLLAAGATREVPYDVASLGIRPGTTTDVAILYRVEGQGRSAEGSTTFRVHAALPPEEPGERTTGALPMIALASGALAASLALAVRSERGHWFLAGLYTRLLPSKLLEHGRRQDLHAIVAREPGITFADAQRALGLGTGAMVHHVRALERASLLVTRREGANRRLYPVGGTPLPGAPRGPALTPMQARVLDLLSTGPLTQREIAERLGLTQQGANKHVKALQRAGMVALRDEAGRLVVEAVHRPLVASGMPPGPA